MLELAAELLPVLRAGHAVAVVTVTAVARSAPRGVGASMAIVDDGRLIGSISGGCVEGDAVLIAHGALAEGRARAAHFGYTDAQAHTAGLACGGAVTVLAYPLHATDATTVHALTAAASGRAVSLGIVASGPRAGESVDLANAACHLDDTPSAVTRAVALRASALLSGACDGEDLLVLSRAPRARLIVLGAGEHAAALSRLGAQAGFAVTVCDAWELLVTPERFPQAEQLVAALPHEFLRSLGPEDIDLRTAVCVLTHDERLDVPALQAALSLPVGFVGAMGARSTVERRAMLLREAGVHDADLARLHSPLGLDLGGSSPEEVALSVLAEIVASRHDGSGRPLRDLDGPVHRTSGEMSGETMSCAPAEHDHRAVGVS